MGISCKYILLFDQPCTSTCIDCKRLYEVWFGKPADYSLLKVGSTIYYHVSEGKLEPRAKKGVFVGFGSGVKGYRI